MISLKENDLDLDKKIDLMIVIIGEINLQEADQEVTEEAEIEMTDSKGDQEIVKRNIALIVHPKTKAPINHRIPKRCRNSIILKLNKS